MSKDNLRRTALDAIRELAEQESGVEEVRASVARRSRAWERRHSATSLRLYEDDHRWLREFAARLDITQDVAGRGLIHAAREAVENGLLVVEVEREIVTDKSNNGRPRTRVETELRTDWQIRRS